MIELQSVMKAREVKVTAFQDASAAMLAAAVQTFTQSLGEAVLLSLQFTGDGTVFAAFVVYAT